MNEPPLIRNIHNIGIPRSVTGRTARAEAAKIGASQPSAGGQGRFHESAGGAEHPRAVVPALVQHQRAAQCVVDAPGAKPGPQFPAGISPALSVRPDRNSGRSRQAGSVHAQDSATAGSGEPAEPALPHAMDRSGCRPAQLGASRHHEHCLLRQRLSRKSRAEGDVEWSVHARDRQPRRVRITAQRAHGLLGQRGPRFAAHEQLPTLASRTSEP
jgi:hypothetical protein